MVDFKEPILKARFVLDNSGKPAERTSGHYKIKLFVEGVPEDAYSVTYQLDPSYYDPIRETLSPSNGFAEDITSYGDFLVTARIRTPSATIPIQRSLSQALIETHSGEITPEIQKGLQDIIDN